MNWAMEDWEYPNDHIYAIERYQDVVNSWHQWEEEQAAKNRLPAVIKVLTPITHEVKHNTSTVRGAYQERL
jgi:hypothetical protein